MEMLEILDDDKESNFNNANSFKNPPLFSYNLRSPYKLYSTQMAQAIILDIDINKCLPIQILLVNK